MAKAKSKRSGKHGNSVYSDALAVKICEWISSGKSLISFCNFGNNPRQETVYRWLRENESFREIYIRAREEQAETFADEIKDIADRETDANLARVRIDARKWLAGKLKPKLYGDRIEANTTIGFAGEFETFIKALNERKAQALLPPAQKITAIDADE